MSSFLQILLQQMQDLPMPGNELAAQQQAQAAQQEQMQQAMMQQMAQRQGRTVQAAPAQTRMVEAAPAQTRTVEVQPPETRMVQAQPLGGEEMMADNPPKRSTQVRLSSKALAELLKHARG